MSNLHRLSILLVLSASAIAQAGTIRGPLFVDRGGLAPRVMASASARQIVEALVAGPTAAERRAGWTTAIPTGTRLLALTPCAGPIGNGIRVRLSSEFAGVVRSARLEVALEQLVKTVVRSSSWTDIFVEVQFPSGRVRSLDSLMRARGVALPLVPARTSPRRGGSTPTAVRGALSGKTVAISPGHGYYWHTSLGWTTQRPLIGGLIEDIHTNEIAMRFLLPYLENMGARVFSCRDRGEITREVIGDNDQGPSVYSETGAWSRSSSNGYNGGSYRFVATSATSTATATWSLRVPATGMYPVHVFFRAGQNRASMARYRVHHAGGVSEVEVDQTRDNLTWVHLGDFWFDGGSRARIVLDNRGSPLGRVVIADAARIGAGLGSISRGGRTSGQPRWREASRYWAQYAGAPSSVWNSVSTGQDNSDDVTCRPRFSEWRGADAYVSLHTNAGGGSGTSSFIHNTAPTRGSADLQRAVHTQIVGDIRRLWDASWIDRGRQSANFGEVRLLRTMPGVLVELAFHDTDRSKDHNSLHDPEFRRIGARAIARGVLRYFNRTAPFPPSRPTGVRVTQDGRGGLLVAWDSVAAATGYSIERSVDGKGFVEVAQTNGRSWSTGPLAHGSAWSFRVRAFNASGRSFPSDVLTAGTSHDLRAEVLLVYGFDRVGKTVKRIENTRDYLRQHGDAIRRGAEFSLGFDACENEAVLRGRVSLGSYRCVVWALGEESTVDETFSASEQALVRTYLANGGRLLVTGAEVGWDLDSRGSTADRAFYRGVLGVRYVRDDAATYGFTGATSGIFQGIAAGTFDSGNGGTYDVDYPDVLAPADSKSSVCLLYSGGQVAGIQRIDGQSRVVHLGFPLETIRSAALRADIMRRALRFLLSPRPLEMVSRVPIGGRVPVALSVPNRAGRIYVLAASAATRPGIRLPSGATLPLQPDALFGVSLGASNGVFQRFAGQLDGQGRATAQVQIPPLSGLRGLAFFVSGLTLLPNGSGFDLVFPWYRLQVQ